jgi:general transcriptional corepressor CYC8
VLSGSVLELQGDLDGAIQAYERAIRHNAWSVPAMQAISTILRAKDQFGVAIDYLRTILKIDSANGEVWGSLGTPNSRLSTGCKLLTCLTKQAIAIS